VGLDIQTLLAAAKSPRQRARLRGRRRLKAVRPNRKTELAYKARLLAVVKRLRGLVEATLRGLRDEWPTAAGDSMVAADAAPMSFERMLKDAASQLGNIGQLAKRLAGFAAASVRDDVDSRLGDSIRQAIGVDVSSLLRANGPLLASMQTATTANVELIKSIPEQYLERVRETVTNGWSQGLRWEALVEQIQHDGDVTESRAELIARDQVAKMNSSFNQERQQQVGIEKYEWSTSQDERVREEHAKVDGMVFRWDEPGPVPSVVDGAPCHAGFDIACRCVPIPVIEFESSGEMEAAA
jgi:SPP1 gp7 family putative phage head morphogenesis protein